MNGIPQDGPERLRYAAGVMLAAADGAEIQFADRDDDIFQTRPEPVWNWRLFDYRVDPKPPRVCKAVYSMKSSGDPWDSVFPLSTEVHTNSEMVPLIELTQQVRAALAAAGIDYEGREDV